MLSPVLRSSFLRSSLRTRQHASPLARRRTFITLPAITEGFLDLAIALPFPASWPPYSSTIILVSVLSRLVLTLPVSIWAKKQEFRMEELVVPKLVAARPIASKVVHKELARQRVRGTKEELAARHSAETAKLLEETRQKLFNKYGIVGWPTWLAPVVTQIPLFFGMSMMFNKACAYPTPLDSESFLTLTSLAHQDPTMALPIAVGFLTLANVEASQLGITPEMKARADKQDQVVEERRKKGEIVLRLPKHRLRDAFRLASLVRILIGATLPGGVLLYWVTSAAFGLFQTWAFEYWRRRRVARLSSQLSPVAPPELKP